MFSGLWEHRQKIEDSLRMRPDGLRRNCPACHSNAGPSFRGSGVVLQKYSGSDGIDIHRPQLAAVLGVRLHFVCYLLPLGKGAVSSSLDGGKMDEYIAAPVVIGDKAIALLRVEPFYSSVVHG